MATKEVKCVFCAEKGFKSKEHLLAHFVDVHSIPKNDAILSRYVNLRFNLKEGEVGKKMKVIILLLKSLKQRAALYTLQRDKVKLDSSKIRHFFIEYENFDASMRLIVKTQSLILWKGKE